MTVPVGGGERLPAFNDYAGRFLRGFRVQLSELVEAACTAALVAPAPTQVHVWTWYTIGGDTIRYHAATQLVPCATMADVQIIEHPWGAQPNDENVSSVSFKE